MGRFSKLTASLKKFFKWLFGLLIINLAGLILITLYSAYYSFGTMIFGVHTAAALKDFWNTEFITAIPFVIGVNLLAINTALFRMYKNKKPKNSQFDSLMQAMFQKGPFYPSC